MLQTDSQNYSNTIIRSTAHFIQIFKLNNKPTSFLLNVLFFLMYSFFSKMIFYEVIAIVHIIIILYTVNIVTAKV